MRIALLALFLTALPSISHSRCATAADLATGITFKRDDGRTGLVQSDGDAILVDYATNAKGAWMDRRTTRRGIYETAWEWTPTEEYYVGGGPGGSYAFAFTGKPPEPRAGESWKTRVTVKETHENGTEYGPEIRRSAKDAIFTFQEVTEAKLSGCIYRIQPVEARFTGKNTDVTQRWIYFPDLGFGLETRTTDHQTGATRKLGLTALAAKG